MKIYIKGIDNEIIMENIFISGSKSESNRLLILQKLFYGITINNLSDSDDTHHLQHALFTNDISINIGHAGTAMRFLTAFFAAQSNSCLLYTSPSPRDVEESRMPSSA